MTAKIFIDGEHGTTGLQIGARLAGRADLRLLSLAPEDRRNVDARAGLLREADIAVLCLPDDAARQSVELAKGAGTRMIDASTAHRTDPDWAFGFPEMTPGHDRVIANAQYVSNPGCYSTGAIALIKPLIDAGVVPTDYPLIINGVSGYTGGGKGLIARMEDETAEGHIGSVMYAYALSLGHKHVPEIMSRCGLSKRPLFTPSVGRFRQGMLVQVPLHLSTLTGNPSRAAVHGMLAEHYADAVFVRVAGLDEADRLERLDPEGLVGTNDMRLYVFGNDEQVNLVAQLDNLGKGASGAAVQNLDLMLGAAVEDAHAEAALAVG